MELYEQSKPTIFATFVFFAIFKKWYFSSTNYQKKYRDRRKSQQK